MSELDPTPAPDVGFGAYFQQLEQQAAEGRAVIAAACPRLAELGVAEVHIAYDGYGDSGGVEGVTAVAGERIVELPPELSTPLADAAEAILPSGWENDGGAFGELVLDVASRSLKRAHNWRVESSDYDEEQWQL